MQHDRWDEVKRVFAEVVGLSHAERAAALDILCSKDDMLRAEVEELLAAEDREPAYLNPDAGDAAIAALSAGKSDLLGAERTDASFHMGRYTLLRTLGEGGMGTVFEAEDTALHRRVAVKLLSSIPGPLGRRGTRNRAAIKRFEYESRILASLSHPAIAQVFETGVHQSTDGTSMPFFSMELVEGARDIISYAREHALSDGDVLGIFLEICDGVTHGHQKGVIHRDLKPDNILIDRQGRPKIIDFGVARVVSDAPAVSTLTNTGDILGSLRYMSPEQCGGDSHATDVRSDVYSLGVVLYELLTGRLPYDCDTSSIVAAVRAIRENEPKRPSTITARMPSDLETITLKALAKDPTRRYQSVSDLAEEIRRFLDGRPIAARPPSALYQARMFARRNRGLVGGVLVAVLLLVLGVIGTSIGLVRARDSAQRARAAEQIADQRARESEKLAYRASISTATNALVNNDGGLAQQYLADAPVLLRGWEWRHLSRRAESSVIVLEGEASANSITTTLDGRTILLGGGAQHPSRVRAVEPSNGTDRWRIDLPNVGGTVAVRGVSRDGRRASWNDANVVGIIDVAIGTEIARINVQNSIDQLCVPQLNGDGSKVAWGVLSGRELILADCATGSLVWRVPTLAPMSQWRHLKFSHDDQRIILREGAEIISRSVRTGEVVHRIPLPPQPESELQGWEINRDESLVAVESGKNLRLFDAKTASQIKEFQGHELRVEGIEFSPAGRRLTTTSIDKTIRVWEVDGSRLPIVFSGSATPTGPLSFIGEDRVASIGWDGIVRVFELGSQYALRELKFARGGSSAMALRFSSDGEVLCGYRADGEGDGRPAEIAHWNLRGQMVRSLPLPRSLCSQVCIDSALGAIFGSDEALRVTCWNVDDMTVRWRSDVPCAFAQTACLSPDDSMLVTGHDDHRLRVWDTTTGELKRTITLPEKEVAYRLCVTQRDRVLIVYAWKDTLGVCDLEAGTLLAHVDRTKGVVDGGMDVSPDGTMLAVADGDDRVRIYDLALKAPPHVYPCAASFAHTIAFSPDGSRLAVGTRDCIVRIVDVESGKELLQLRNLAHRLMQVAWSPDGRRLAASSDSLFDPVIVWDAAPATPLNTNSQMRKPRRRKSDSNPVRTRRRLSYIPWAYLTTVLTTSLGHAQDSRSFNWIQHRTPAPVSRQSHGMSFDSERGVAALFGGYSFPGHTIFHSDLWEWDGEVWHERTTDPLGPTQRSAHGQVYDAARRETLIFGGCNSSGNYLGDFWAWNGTSWKRHHANGAPDAPSPRTTPAIAFDSDRKVVVLFGGGDLKRSLVDLWEWNGTSWSRRETPTHPPVRESAAFAYDEARKVCVLFGGENGAAILNDTWEWNGEMWIERKPSHAPPPRSRAATAFDAIRKAVVVMGGGIPSRIYDESWEWDGTDWTRHDCPGRSWAAACWDSKRERILRFGGYAMWSNGDFIELDAKADAFRAIESVPQSRFFHSLASCSKSGSVVLFGGLGGDSSTTFGDTWTWNDSTWARVTSPSPPARFGHAMAEIETKGLVVMYGGAHRTDTWIWNRDRWSEQKTVNNPGFRKHPCMTRDAVEGRVVLYGGANDDRTWGFDGENWTVLANTGPRPRYGAMVAFDELRHRVVMYGGLGYDFSILMDTWEWDGTSWSRVATPQSPGPRSFGSMVFEAACGRSLLLGGMEPSGSMSSIWSFDGASWIEQSFRLPEERHSHATCVLPSSKRVFMFGGRRMISPAHDTTWELTSSP